MLESLIFIQYLIDNKFQIQPTIMKIKKTQPSVFQYTRQFQSQNRNTYPQYPDTHIIPDNNFVQENRSRSSSPRKPIFEKNSSSKQRKYVEQKASQHLLQHRSNRPHSLIIKQEKNQDIVTQFNGKSKYEHQENEQRTRKRSRRKIFQHSLKKTSANQSYRNETHDFKIMVSPPKPHNSSNNVIPVKLNIKELSQKIKKNEQSPKNQIQILSKISHLERIVQDIHNKVSSRDIETHNNKQNKIIIIKNQRDHNVNHKQTHNQQITIDSRARSYSQMESNLVLKLQLQQMRRCERIAKENQILYGKLVKNIQENQNELNRSIASTYRFQNIYSNRSSRSIKRYSPGKKSKQKSSQKKYNFDSRNSRNVKNKINTFEDFDHIDLRSRHTDEYDGTLQITSPFLIEQNEGNITYNSRKKYY